METLPLAPVPPVLRASPLSHPALSRLHVRIVAAPAVEQKLRKEQGLWGQTRNHAKSMRLHPRGALWGFKRRHLGLPSSQPHWEGREGGREEGEVEGRADL